MIIPYAKISPDAFAPTHNHTGDAGMDFYSIDDVIIHEYNFRLVRTGIKIQLPEGYVGLLFPKGGNDHLLGAGVVDTYYEGEILFKVVNYSNRAMFIDKGEAIGQMIIVPFIEPKPREMWYERDSERGDTGGIKKDLDT